MLKVVSVYAWASGTLVFIKASSIMYTNVGHRTNLKSLVAQLVEPGACNARFVGSIPTSTKKISKIAPTTVSEIRVSAKLLKCKSQFLMVMMSGIKM